MLLFVLFSYPALADTPPAIVEQPMEYSIVVSHGTIELIDVTAEYSVTADGTAPLTYQWQRSSNNGSTWSDISGANAPDYSFTAQMSDAGALFRVVVSNNHGSVTSDSAPFLIFYPHPPIFRDGGCDSFASGFAALVLLLTGAFSVYRRTKASVDDRIITN